MSTDSAPLVVTDADPKDASRGTLLSMIIHALCNIKYKSLIFLFILFILITSDVFVNVLLKKLDGAVDEHGYSTPYGTVVQGLFLVLGHMVLNFCIEQELI
jgi:hypothetical protein